MLRRKVDRRQTSRRQTSRRQTPRSRRCRCPRRPAGPPSYRTQAPAQTDRKRSATDFIRISRWSGAMERTKENVMDGRNRIWSRRWLQRLALLLPGLMLGNLGCGTYPNLRTDNFSTIPPGRLPEPCGIYVREYQARQNLKASADKFVIYAQEWYMNGMELSPYGLTHLDRIIQVLPHVPYNVLIEVSPYADLNRARWEFIVTALARAGIPAPEMRVVIGFPQAE